MTARPLWRCPKCGRTFVTRNMAHSCRHLSFADHLAGKPPKILALYDYLSWLEEQVVEALAS